MTRAIDGVKARADVLETLAAIPATSIHSGELGSRPPIGVYNVGFDRVLNRIERLFNPVEEIARGHWTAEALPNYETTLEALEAFLYALLEHVDDCRSILRALFDSPTSFKRSRHVRKYDQEIRPYRDHIGSVVNAIKHRQGRLRAVSVFSPHYLIPGYYVETAYPDGMIGPDKDIHDNGDTAFSCYENCRYHFVNLFRCAFLLNEAVQNILSQANTSSPHTDQNELRRVLEVARRLCALPNTCFLDEIFKPAASIQMQSKENAIETFELKFGKGVSARRTLDGFNVKLEFRGDGASRNFKIPYFGERFKKMMQSKLQTLSVA